ncbi:hypothetical protein ACQP1P_38670 [Dactylosporangium sp. CA-052675]|uniref:hypothetical protein n=1 Tax=Dactylosporangium sp. CA-052675 TaxID=3239927 RepID=UPI003D94A3E7
MSGYTDADVQLVAQAANDVRDDTPTEVARRVLAALAGAGRLVPNDAERVEEWRVQRFDIETHAWDPWPQPSRRSAELVCEEAVWGEHARVERREVVAWASPWVEADGTP